MHTQAGEANYVVVQAGGKGSRLGYLTENKPKALVPVENRPMLFHLFDRFPDKKFVVIGDYQYDVLERYLKAFAKVDYTVLNAGGKRGTCAGVPRALQMVPPGEPFLLIWSDLVLRDAIPPLEAGRCYVGISKNFECRWSFRDNRFYEEKSARHGVAGLFAFSDKQALREVPQEGELVRWLASQKISFTEIPLTKTREYGLLEDYQNLSAEKCRPFNRVEMNETTFIKEGVDEQGRRLAALERSWYQKAAQLGLKNIPQIYDYDPLQMERIRGKNVYEYAGLGGEEKKAVLKSLVRCLERTHALGTVAADPVSYRKAYIDKTKERLETVRELVPFAREPMVRVNGRDCPNIFFCWDKVEALVLKYMPRTFVFLHGDCTFSNMMLRENGEPVLIDPRGYFGDTMYYGDAAYDWAKLYYSVAGNYDAFNLKKFRLHIKDNEVALEIASNGWEGLESFFFETLEKAVSKEQIKLLHAIIWLSLTTYAWQDYDSICGAFYNGLYYLEEVL